MKKSNSKMKKKKAKKIQKVKNIIINVKNQPIKELQRKIKKLKTRIISHEIKDCLNELGLRVYYLMKHRRKIVSNKTVKRLSKEIGKLKKELNSL